MFVTVLCVCLNGLSSVVVCADLTCGLTHCLCVSGAGRGVLRRTDRSGALFHAAGEGTGGSPGPALLQSHGEGSACDGLQTHAGSRAAGAHLHHPP